jgi:lysophospholipase L1-like esterase
MIAPFRPVIALGLLLALAAPAWAQPFEERWRTRVGEFRAENARLAPDAKTVVLLGSSSMEGWRYSNRVTRFLPPGRQFLNRGISGDGIGQGTTGVKNRLDSSAFDCKPSHVFLLNGHNSVGRDGSGLASTMRLYDDVVASLRERLPTVVVVLITCQPTEGATYGALAPHLLTLNARIREIAAARGCPLIDLHAKTVGPDGLRPRAGLSADGIHMTDAGYHILGDEIARILSTIGSLPAPTPVVTPAPTPPATPTPVTPPSPSTERTHVVQKGDTLSKIAKRYGTTVGRLVALNGIANPNVIVVGRRLRLPPTAGLSGSIGG